MWFYGILGLFSDIQIYLDVMAEKHFKKFRIVEISITLHSFRFDKFIKFVKSCPSLFK